MPLTAREVASLRFAGARVFREMPDASIKEQVHAIMTEHDRIQGKVQAFRNPATKQENHMDIKAVRQEIDATQKTIGFLKTVATLFSIAAPAADSKTADGLRFPHPVEISELFESLATAADESVNRVEGRLSQVEGGQR